MENSRRTCILSQKVHFRTYEEAMEHASPHTPAPSARNMFLYARMRVQLYPRLTPLYANNLRTFALCMRLYLYLPFARISLCLVSISGSYNRA